MIVTRRTTGLVAMSLSSTCPLWFRPMPDQQRQFPDFAACATFAKWQTIYKLTLNWQNSGGQLLKGASRRRRPIPRDHRGHQDVLPARHRVGAESRTTDHPSWHAQRTDVLPLAIRPCCSSPPRHLGTDQRSNRHQGGDTCASPRSGSGQCLGEAPERRLRWPIRTRDHAVRARRASISSSATARVVECLSNRLRRSVFKWFDAGGLGSCG